PESINDADLNKLLSQEAALLRQLIDTAPAQGILRTANPCWISYTTFAATPNLSKEELSGLTLQQARELVNNIDLYEKTNKQAVIVQKGDPLARCVNSMDYNLVALLPDYALKTESDNFGISLNERRLLLDDITIVQKAVSSDTVLALQTKASFGDLMDTQILRQADLLIQRHSGIKVPLQSLYDYSETDHIARLLKISDGITKEVIVFVQAEDGTHAIIEGRTGDTEAPAENDLYVLNPWTGAPGNLLE
ncbi:MAG TPA: HlyD family efflux transporter periplasmic adaptor subunit, partial [Oscillospiraceae bacterium]|nr:HlyD family efflux transporter periplasmic adaptor subunit [Oscillospiraceae bacterium]